MDGTTALGTVALVNGVATFSSTYLAVGSHSSITAVYAGTDYFLSSTSAPLTLTVGKAHLTIAPNGGQSKVYGTANPALTYSITGFVNGESLSGGGVTGAPTLTTTATTTSPFGSYPITTAIGSLSSANYDFAISNVTVSLAVVAPTLVLQSISTQRNKEGDRASLLLQPLTTYNGGAALTYRAVNLPPGLSINAATGAITGTIAAGDAAGGVNANGIYAVTVGVTDGTVSSSATFSWSIAVPVGTGTGLYAQYFSDATLTTEAQHRVDPTVNFDFAATPPPAPTPSHDFSVRWTGTVQPLYSEVYTFITNSDDGVRVWVNGQQLINDWNDHAPTTDRGTTSIALTAGQLYGIRVEYYENNIGQALMQLSWSSARQGLQIIPQSQIYSIGLTAIADQQNREGDRSTLQAQANYTSPSLTYSAGNLPPGLTINSQTGAITGTIAAGAATGGDFADDDYAVTVRVADGAVSSSVKFNWDVTPRITISDIVDQQNSEGDRVLNLPVQATSPDSNPLTYRAQNLPTGLSINPATGAISGIIAPGANTGGDNASDDYTVTISVTDRTYSSTITFAWDVISQIAISDIGDQQNKEGASLNLLVQATSLSGTPLTYSAGNLPPGLSINPATGAITGIITAGSATTGDVHDGNYTVSVNVTDGVYKSSVRFNWDVTPVVVAGPSSPPPTVPAGTLQTNPPTSSGIQQAVQAAPNGAAPVFAAETPPVPAPNNAPPKNIYVNVGYGPIAKANNTAIERGLIVGDQELPGFFFKRNTSQVVTTRLVFEKSADGKSTTVTIDFSTQILSSTKLVNVETLNAALALAKPGVAVAQTIKDWIAGQNVSNKELKLTATAFSYGIQSTITLGKTVGQINIRKDILDRLGYQKIYDDEETQRKTIKAILAKGDKPNPAQWAEFAESYYMVKMLNQAGVLIGGELIDKK